MTPRGGTVVVLQLLLAHAALAMMSGQTGKYGVPMLMRKCLKMGHSVPMMMDEQNPFNNSSMSDMSDTGNGTGNGTWNGTGNGTGNGTWNGTGNGSTPFMFHSIASYLHSHPNMSMELHDSNNWMMNRTSLLSLIKLIRKSPDAILRCFKWAHLAPLAWASLSSGDTMDSEDLAELAWASKLYLQNMPPSRINLPPRMQRAPMRKMMEMLREVFSSLSQDQRVQVRQWVQEWATQTYFNCSLSGRKPKPKQRINPLKPFGSKPAQNQSPGGPQQDGPENNPLVRPPGRLGRCPRKVAWLKMEMMKMMGPFLSLLGVDDVKHIAEGQLCQFFQSPEFNTSFRVARVKPFLARRLLRILKVCLRSKEEFSQHVDRLGALACYYDDAPPRSMDLIKRLLSQLDNCSNSRGKKLKKRLVRTVMSQEAVLPEDLHRYMSELSPRQLSRFSVPALRDALRAQGPGVQWRPARARKLVQRLLQGRNMSGDDLIDLGPALSGVWTSSLTGVNLQMFLGREVLRTMTERMSKAQRKALLVGLRGVSASELVQNAPDALLRSLSLATLENTTLSLDDLGDKRWSRAQFAYLLRKIMGGNQIRLKDIRKLVGPAIQGLACKMIDGIPDDDAKAMAQTLTDTSRWLSKVKVCCAARKLFESLENQRPVYFQNISQEELDDIPTFLLIHLPPWTIRALPDSVCPAFLDKMAEANLSSLPCRAPQRLALTDRALRCLAQGRNISALSSEEVLRMGSLLCELPPFQLTAMSPEALNSSLLAMASCAQIPPRHRGALIQLLNNTYGDPSDWSVETMESLGPLLLLDAAAIRALRYKPWLQGVLSDLLDSLPRPPGSPLPKEVQTGPDLKTLKEKLFSLVMRSSGSDSSASRRKREAEGAGVDQDLTVSLIEDLGRSVVYLSPQQLSNMSAQVFRDTVETLGDVTDYSPEQLRVLRQKAIEAWGPVQGLNESQGVQLGCVSQGFTLTELQNISISSLDALETLTQCGWTQPQREAVWRGFIKRTGLSVGQLGAVEITQLNQFICGLSAEEIRQVSVEAFREAVDSISDVQCPLVVNEELKRRAVAVFGQPDGWTDAVVITLGNIMAGLSAAELTSLDPSVFSSFQPTSIPLIPADRLNALSVSQLKSLGPDNIAMLTETQKEGLDQEKMAAIESTLGETRDPEPTATAQKHKPASAGAPSQSAEGLAGFVKPVLVLALVVFLL